MRTAVITGVAGLFGANFSRFLLSRGWTVVGVDDLSGGYAESLPKSEGFEFHRVDLNDFSAFNSIFGRSRPDVVYHFAAYAAEGLSPFIRRHNYERNLLATSSVINCAIQYDAKVVFTSSMAVYGRQRPPFTESMTPMPVDPYGIAKFASEQDLEVAKEHHGLRYSIVRPHNVIGPFQNIWDRYRNVAGIFVRRGLEGLPLQVFGDGSQVRAFSNVRDYMSPLLQLADRHDGEVFNIGSDNLSSVLALAETVVAELGKIGITARIKHEEPRFEVSEAFCSHDKAVEELGFNDTTSLEATIAELVRWAQSVEPRVVKTMKYEIEKGLYGFWKQGS